MPQSINADEILANVLKARHFKVSNDRSRREIKLKQNTHNLINSRDSLLWYVNNTTTPALKTRLTNDLYKMSSKIDDNTFKLYVLGKRDNLIKLYIIDD